MEDGVWTMIAIAVPTINKIIPKPFAFGDI